MTRHRETSENPERDKGEIETLRNNFFQAIDVFLSWLTPSQIWWLAEILDAYSVISYPTLFVKIDSDIPIADKDSANWESMKDQYDPILDRNISVEFSVFLEKLILLRAQSALS